MAIKFAVEHHLGEFLNGRQERSPQEVLQALDVVLRELLTRRLLICAGFFSRVSVPHVQKFD